MERLQNVSFQKIDQSFYYRPILMTYKQDNEMKTYEIAEKHSCVAILLFHKEFKKFLVVRQFRPPICVNRVKRMEENRGKELNEIEWDKFDTELGYTIELCAGMVDKNKSLEQIACEEISEECGYLVHPEQLYKIQTSIYDLDTSGVFHNLYYMEIDESMKIGEGGGNINELEMITKVFITMEEIETRCGTSPPGFAYAFYWWKHLRNKEKLEKDPSLWPGCFYEGLPGRMSDFSFNRDFLAQKDDLIRMKYTLGPLNKVWDLRLRDDGVCVLLHVVDTDHVIFLRRFRPAAVVGTARNKPENMGKMVEEIEINGDDLKSSVTMEPIGAIMFPDENVEEAAKRAVAKKAGYRVTNLELIRSFILGISMGGDMLHLFYAQVTEKDRIVDFNELPDATVFHLNKKALPHLLADEHPVGPPILHFGAAYLIEKLK